MPKLTANPEKNVQASQIISEWKKLWQEKYGNSPVLIKISDRIRTIRYILEERSYEYVMLVLEQFFKSGHYSATRNKHSIDDFAYNFHVFQSELQDVKEPIIVDKKSELAFGKTIWKDGKMWTQGKEGTDWVSEDGKSMPDVAMKKVLEKTAVNT